MVEIHAVGRDGSRQTLQADAGRPLMEVLREADMGVEGICGGACSCGTCHVYVGGDGLSRLPPRSEDEQMMLDAIGELVSVRPESRLSCQIVLSAELDGLEVAVGPVP